MGPDLKNALEFSTVCATYAYENRVLLQNKTNNTKVNNMGQILTVSTGLAWLGLAGSFCVAFIPPKPDIDLK